MHSPFQIICSSVHPSVHSNHLTFSFTNPAEESVPIMMARREDSVFQKKRSGVPKGGRGIHHAGHDLKVECPRVHNGDAWLPLGGRRCGVCGGESTVVSDAAAGRCRRAGF